MCVCYCSTILYEGYWHSKNTHFSRYNSSVLHIIIAFPLQIWKKRLQCEKGIQPTRLMVLPPIGTRMSVCHRLRPCPGCLSIPSVCTLTSMAAILPATGQQLRSPRRSGRGPTAQHHGAATPARRSAGQVGLAVLPARSPEVLVLCLGMSGVSVCGLMSPSLGGNLPSPRMVKGLHGR